MTELSMEGLQDALRAAGEQKLQFVFGALGSVFTARVLLFQVCGQPPASVHWTLGKQGADMPTGLKCPGKREMTGSLGRTA